MRVQFQIFPNVFAAMTLGIAQNETFLNSITDISLVRKKFHKKTFVLNLEFSLYVARNYTTLSLVYIITRYCVNSSSGEVGSFNVHYSAFIVVTIITHLMKICEQFLKL